MEAAESPPEWCGLSLALGWLPLEMAPTRSGVLARQARIISSAFAETGGVSGGDGGDGGNGGGAAGEGGGAAGEGGGAAGGGGSGGDGYGGAHGGDRGDGGGRR